MSESFSWLKLLGVLFTLLGVALLPGSGPDFLRSRRCAPPQGDPARAVAIEIVDRAEMAKGERPTKQEVLASEGRTVPDVIAPGLRVLFCGINPGLYSGAAGHHFARPGNRFWPALHAAGFTDRLLSPFEEREMLRLGYGITNLVERATAAADALSVEELIAGRQRLEEKVRHFRSRCVAVLGISAYRAAFRRPRAQLGRQSERLGGAMVWVLPNPSGLNAHYRPRDLADLFSALRLALGDGL